MPALRTPHQNIHVERDLRQVWLRFASTALRSAISSLANPPETKIDDVVSFSAATADRMMAAYIDRFVTPLHGKDGTQCSPQ